MYRCPAGCFLFYGNSQLLWGVRIVHGTHHLPEEIHRGHLHGRFREWLWEKKSMDVFDLNLLLIVFLSLIITSAHFIPGNSGSILLAALSRSSHLPVFMLMVTFMAMPVSVYIGFRSEDYRDTFLVNVLFIILLMLMALLDQISAGPMEFHLPNFLYFGLNLRMDRFTLLLVMGATLLWMAAMVFGHRYMQAEEERRSRFYGSMMITYGCVLGGMMAYDLFTMFFFFEIMYLSCYFMVSHSQTPESMQAGNRYIYMGVVGGLSMFLGICLIYYTTGTLLISGIRGGLETAWVDHGLLLTGAIISFLIGFVIKAAIFPLHFWLPNAHASAPSPASAVLSGMVIKVYIFSLMKFLYIAVGRDLFSAMGLVSFFAPVAVVGMIMGSVFAIGQTELKKMLAYSTVAQVGYMLLGIGLMTPLGLSASLFHVITHALMKSALFLSAGAILYQTGIKRIKDMNGLGYRMPVTMGVFTVGALAMIGIPGFNGFMSKWYLGTAALEAGRPVFVLMLLVSSFLNAMYYLPIIIAAFLKKEDPEMVEETGMTLDRIPMSMMIPLLCLGFGCVLLGFFPQLVMGFIQKGIFTFFQPV